MQLEVRVATTFGEVRTVRRKRNTSQCLRRGVRCSLLPDQRKHYRTTHVGMVYYVSIVYFKKTNTFENQKTTYA